MKIGVVVPVLNNFVGLTELFLSLSHQEITPYVIPNWVTNRGVAGAWNAGTREALANGCTHIAILNDDVILHSMSLSHMADRLDISTKPVILVSGRNCREGNQGSQIPYYQAMDKVNLSMKMDQDESDSPDFSCFMITKRTIEEVGWFDEHFFPAYFDDNDYHYRIHLAGLITANISSAPMFHRGSITQNMNKAPVVPSPIFERNRQYFRAKWGGIPGHETFKTPFDKPDLTHRDI